jgi:hypothetical protein
MINAYKILVQKSKGKEPLRTPKGRKKDVKMLVAK